MVLEPCLASNITEISKEIRILLFDVCFDYFFQVLQISNKKTAMANLFTSCHIKYRKRLNKLMLVSL